MLAIQCEIFGAYVGWGVLACIAFSLFNLDIRVRVRVRLLWVFGSRGRGVETNPIPVVATLAKPGGRHCDFSLQ